jgi:UDP-N-acetylmuramoylalanine--D-glutamate ligase
MYAPGHIFAGKRITQMGLGVLGRGIGDAAFLARQGAELVVTDMKTKEALTVALQELALYPAITYRLGEHMLADFENRDLILKGAGVPLASPYIAHARSHHVPVDMSASLFARTTGIPIVGVTGTRGKSTVTHLIEAILRADGRTTLLGGNVRGVSNLALFDVVTSEHIGVFELDSWQCQGFGEEYSLASSLVRQGPLSPHVAVFTTFMPDHLNYYGGDLVAYLKDKTHIFAHQGESDVCIVGKQALEALTPYKKQMRAHVIVADASDVPKGWHVALPGAHNRYNVGVAVATARALGVDDAVIESVVASFQALPGRLEKVREYHGVAIYNDTNATTPDATRTALLALDPEQKKRIVLIMGGADKQLDTTALQEALLMYTKNVVLLAGTGTDTLTYTAPVAHTLGEAVQEAWKQCVPGDILLFSPGFASFGMFANEYDRGEQFNALVHALT